MTTPTDPAPAPTPAPTSDPAPAATPAAADPIAQLTAALDAIRADLAALKEAKPAPVQVPTTDQGRPTITPVTLDLSSLPPVARMAAGYSK